LGPEDAAPTIRVLPGFRLGREEAEGPAPQNLQEENTVKYILRNGAEETRYELSDDEDTQPGDDYEMQANFFEAIQDLVHSNEHLVLRFHNTGGTITAICERFIAAIRKANGKEENCQCDIPNAGLPLTGDGTCRTCGKPV
jgi:hypothetical protein